jgi:glycosyltransferase involved in cell wall biosynthesis
MHVLITADTMGGVWTYTRELTTALDKRDVRVTLVSFGDIPTLEQTEWMKGLTRLDYRPTGFKLEWMQDSADDLAASSEYLRMVVDEVKPDLLHLNQYYYGALDCEQPRIVVGHSDVVGWWQSVHGIPPKADEWSRWYRGIVSRGLAHATALVAPSQWMLDSLKRNYQTPSLCSVVYNGRDPLRFESHRSKHRFAVSVGRIWDGGKNAALLTKIESPLLVYLAGRNQQPETGTLVNVQGEGRGLHFKGEQNEEQLRRLYANAGIYVGTSQYEPFGLAPLEAALSRCALLLSDIPSFREIWGDDACYFRNNSAASLQEELGRLAADTDLCATYGSLAYTRATQRYATQRMAEDYMQLYGALLPAGVQAA